MDRRKLGVGLMVLAIGLLLMAGTASARGSLTKPLAVGGEEAGTCQIKNAQDSFVAQGEFDNEATVADVIEVGCDPFEYGTGSTVTVIASQLFSRCGGDISWYVPNTYGGDEWEHYSGRSTELSLDADGNATVALIAGPHCQAGGSLVSVHEDEEPFETFTTEFSVLPPNDTTEGVTTIPSSQIEDAGSSAVATIVEAEFTGGSEKYVRIGSEELYRRCRNDPHLNWVSEDGYVTEDASEINGEDYNALQLDDNGNGFVLALGDSSCSPGSSLVEADLEDKPFTTATTTFTVESPKPRKENP
jgi:hypothetical protein